MQKIHKRIQKICINIYDIGEYTTPEKQGKDIVKFSLLKTVNMTSSDSSE